MLTWRDHALFFQTFLHKPLQLGSLIPTGERVAHRIVDQVNWTGVRTVVELGAGVGPITAVLEQRKPVDVRFLAFEREASFRQVLAQRFPNLPVYDDAAHLRSVLAQHGLRYAEVIISAIPISVLTAAEQEQYLSQMADCLSPDGLCLILQFRPTISARVGRHFGRVSRTLHLRNLPPAIIFRCEHPEPAHAWR